MKTTAWKIQEIVIQIFDYILPIVLNPGCFFFSQSNAPQCDVPIPVTARDIFLVA